jgi:hypothetical protein
MSAIGFALVFASSGCWAEELPVAGPSQRGAMLREALKGADRLELTPNPSGSRKDLSVTITGVEKIATLIQALDFLEPKGGEMHDMCDGDFTVRFFHADKELVQLSHHHGYCLRWHGGKWRGDSEFTRAAAEAWPIWFSDNNFPAFEQARQAKQVERDEEQRKWECFVEPFSGDARKVYADLMKDNEVELANDHAVAARRFLEACGKPYEAGLAICRALGTLRDSPDGAWAFTSLPEQLVIPAFGLIDKDTQASIFAAALKERGADLGAAQLFFHGKFHRDLSQVARESLAPKMLRAVVERDRTDNASRAVEALNEIASVSVNEVLREISAGKVKFTSTEQPIDENSGLRYSAVLSLARRGDPAAPGLIESLSKTTNPSDLAALAIARCFLGERGSIRAEHFQVDSLPLGYALLAALERQGDKEALDLLITAGFESSWALVSCEAVLVVQRITGKIWYPSDSNYQERWYCKDIRAWWQSNKADWQPPDQAPADG